jgi:3-dehydroquinate synthase
MGEPNYHSVRVTLDTRGYDIVVTTGDWAGVGPFARQRSSATKAFVVHDANVRPHATCVFEALTSAAFQVISIELPAGEPQKSLASASLLYDRLAEFEADRKTLVIAVGGGVIGDLAGFVAGTYARGLPLLMVPTTLLAMVDSSVGGKTAVNHPRAKNLIGVFHQPIGVWIDTSFLTTLPEREFRSGLAEVVKYGVILDPDLFTYLETNAAVILERQGEKIRHIIARCCRLKADIVEQDEREESGVRAVLNYGHTFALCLRDGFRI